MNVSAHIAQSVEHFLGKEEVTGSNPVMSSRFSAIAGLVFCLFLFKFNIKLLRRAPNVEGEI